MIHPIRVSLLGSVTVALLGLAGCGENNEKRASEDFKNTQTAPESKPPTNEDIQSRYGGKSKMYGGNMSRKPANAPKPTTGGTEAAK